MDRTMLRALYVILISLGLALIFNFLFFSKLIGVSVVIFAAILLGVVAVFGASQQISLKRTGWMVALIVFFAAMPSLRANEFLNFLNICATLGLLTLLALELTGTPAYLMRLRDYAVSVVMVPLRMLWRAVSTIALVGQIHSSVKQYDIGLRVLKGVVVAVPVLVIFGLLFSQADLAFSQFMKNFVDIKISEHVVQYVALMGLAFVAALSFLSYIFFPQPSQAIADGKQAEVSVPTGRGIEVMVFLGLISTLFLLFIGFQVTYLFGGESNIINAGFTYAEYARRGFWELLAVAMLSLGVLLASEKYAGHESKKDKRFMVPALILVAEVMVIIFSAFKRLSLYIDAYGMTLLRFYVAAIIMLLLVWFILLAVKFIKSKREQFFTFGALLSIAGFLVAVNVANPDEFVINSNIRQYEKTGKIDVPYMKELSADAEAGKIELYHRIEGVDKQALRALLDKQKENLEKSSDDWQSANLSRAKALKLLEELE